VNDEENESDLSYEISLLHYHSICSLMTTTTTTSTTTY